MVLRRLTLCNFRVFQGKHSFDLEPRRKYGRLRPILLFGGLNGAGKTTILTAIRLVLYGKASLGTTVSSKAYQEHLRNSVHKANNAVQAQTAYVELTFSYAKQGHINEYVVKREWSILGRKIEAALTIHKDGVCMEDFSTRQRQAFLNELVPIGVSELFFFDGERIAELAEDTTGQVLQEAVRKLLGLNVIDRLRGDLSVFLRNRKKAMLPEHIQKEIDQLEKKYSEIELQRSQEMRAVDENHKQITALAYEIKNLRSELESKGGGWAKTRSLVLKEQDLLLREKENLEDQIRQIMGGGFPLATVQSQLEELVLDMEKKRSLAKKQLLSEELSDKLKSLRSTLSDALPDAYADKAHRLVKQVFGDLLIQSKVVGKKTPPSLSLSEADAGKINYWVKESIPRDRSRLIKLSAQLQSVEEKLGSAGLKLARAPDESRLKKEFDMLSESNRRLGNLHSQRKQRMEEIDALLSKSIQLNQKMQKLQDQKEATWYSNQSVIYANSTRNMLKKFIARTAQRRAKKLGDEFEHTFAQIARKKDMHVKAHVDPDTFEVTLLNRTGTTISKQELSAGEKQVLAISILGALGRISGRNLPIIIDTPLGRLDSEHRRRLVEHYFPHASHQVIILSTDTEVDADFYKSLSPEISRAYKINYDSERGCSVASAGYFWKRPDQKLPYAS